MLKWICAMSNNNVIWKDWKMPRHKPWDLKRFKEYTKDQIVVMWKATYDSLKGYRPNAEWYPYAKKNIVLSKSMEWNENIEVIPDTQTFLDKYKDDLVWVLWWGKIFDSLMPYIDELYLTIIEDDVQWDTFFPRNFKKHFKSVEITPWLDEGTHYETYRK